MEFVLGCPDKTCKISDDSQLTVIREIGLVI